MIRSQYKYARRIRNIKFVGSVDALIGSTCCNSPTDQRVFTKIQRKRVNRTGCLGVGNIIGNVFGLRQQGIKSIEIMAIIDMFKCYLTGRIFDLIQAEFALLPTE